MQKKSIADEIKKCLKSGIPVAGIAVGIIAACSGCDDQSGKVDKTPPLPSAEKQPQGHEIIAPPPGGLIEVADPEKAEVIEKIVFDDKDFNKDLTNISAVGEQKLADFIKYIDEKYSYYLYRLKVEIPEEDAKRKRKKAQAVFDKIEKKDSNYVRMSGVRISPWQVIMRKIVLELNKEFKFTVESNRW